MAGWYKRVASRRSLNTCFLAFCIALMPLVSLAGDEPDWDVLRRASETTGSLSASFTQQKHLPILSAPLISEGRFFYQAPDAIRWEYVSPIKSVMLMKGDAVEIFQFTDGSWHEDVTRGVQVRQMILGEIREWLKGRFDRGGIFTPSLSQGPPLKVTLAPAKQLTDFLTRIELVFATSPLSIREVDIFEPGEGRTSIHFRDIKINTSLPPATFLRP